MPGRPNRRKPKDTDPLAPNAPPPPPEPEPKKRPARKTPADRARELSAKGQQLLEEAGYANVPGDAGLEPEGPQAVARLEQAVEEELDLPAAGDPLKPQHELFCRMYVGEAFFVQTEAARLAGYRNPELAGWRLMKNEKVAARLRELTNQVMPRNELLARLAAIARLGLGDSAVISVTHNQSGEVVDARIQLRDVLKALELLGKAEGMFRTRVTHEWNKQPDDELFRDLVQGLERSGSPALAQMVRTMVVQLGGEK